MPQAKFYESKEGVAKSLIHMYLPGGSTIRRLGIPKPFAPWNPRSLQRDQHQCRWHPVRRELKHLAKVADKMTIIRSMTHGEAAHERGTHNMFTGYRPSPAPESPASVR